ncbi:MAG: acetaldehyde dehydrogenase (acetylating) [Cellulosilyticaceae bacterium]
MEITDKDLASIQQVRNLLAEAKKAQLQLAQMSQEQIDRIIKAIADAGYANAEKLARMANKETGFGKWEDKIIKNVFASKVIYEAIKDQKTVGIIAEDTTQKTMDIGIPVGVVAGIVPSTNPTSTVIYKAMISIKGGNSIVFSPHPSAKDCIEQTVKVISAAAESAGCPKGAIATITIPTLEATNELMRNKNTALILATGGPAMVKAAYSSGTPAIGVGAGNGPAFIDKSADVKLAVKRILDSKTFDNGTICASEQSIIIEKCMEDKVVSELKAQGAYMLNEQESQQLAKFVLRPNGSMNPQIVGKSVEHVAKLAGLTQVPSSARVLIAKESRVGHDVPYSREKLGLILAFYIEDTVDAVLDKSIKILELEGSGHTYSIHANDHELVKRFSLKIPASRILINTPSALGGIGGSTNLFPAMTLGCGAVGGSSTTNNVGPLDLINIKRVAYGVREIEELRAGAPSTGGSCCHSGPGSHDEMVDLLVKKIMAQLV